jgi:hypothetical protein
VRSGQLQSNCANFLAPTEYFFAAFLVPPPALAQCALSIASSAMASSPGKGVRLSALAAFDVDDELEGRQLHHL